MKVLQHVLFAVLVLIGYPLLACGSIRGELPHLSIGTRRGRIQLQHCAVPEVPGGGLGGRYEVYENRALRTGRKISLNIVILPALSASPAPDPVFWLAGGPGAAATEVAGEANGGFLEDLRKNHDLVLIDQRGTGKSNPLNCEIGDDPANLQEYFGKLFPIGQIQACREKLQRIADLRFYTTPIAMDDLDEVRGALGYQKIDLVAGSYGTIAAQVYVRRHPDHLRAVFLVGVATPSARVPLLFPGGAQHALDLLFVDCAADRTCHGAFPNLEKEFYSILARFDSGPLEVSMIDPTSKRRKLVKLERENYVERLRLMLYTTTFARFVPLVVHQAFQNNFIPFEEISIGYNPGALVARGVYFSVTCSEDVPFITPEEIVMETQGTFVGDTRVKVHIAACKKWPKGDISPSFIDPIKSPLPILMFSGDADGSTPPWLGKAAVKYLPNGRQIEVAHYGHQLDGTCARNILDKFIQKATVQGLDVSCTEKIRRPPFATELPKQLLLQ